MRVVVAGAGFAGLLAAYRVAQAGHEVVVSRRGNGSAAGCGRKNWCPVTRAP
jgi:uncharacterized protein with NAD-binding domain and iron-sulfur cluster